MSIRVFRNMSSLNAQSFLAQNTAVKKPVERAASGTKVNRGRDGAVDFKVSEGLRSDTRTLKITIENLRAADSTICETDIAKEIATLTRRYIIGAAPTAREE